MTSFELSMMPIGELIAADYNPRKLAAKARAKLKRSLETFGLVEPLVWNRRTGRVVGGHQRLGLLREMGVAEVPVSVVDLAESQEKALNVVLNNLEAQGRYDAAKLREVLVDLKAAEELEASGYEQSDLKNLEFLPELEVSEEAAGDVVEVTLATDRSKWPALSPRLDELIREFDLVSHVRGVK